VSAPARKPETVLAAPVVRKLAREMDVDLITVTGTGPGGQITADDVRTAKVSAGLVAPTPRPMVTGDVRVPFRGVRRKIAEHMLRTQREVAQFTYMEEVDATELVELRSKAEARLASHEVKLSYLPFFIRAAVDALKKQPQLNAYLDERAGEIVQRHEYHIGLAAQTPEGLMVPVIRHAERRSLLELAREVERLPRPRAPVTSLPRISAAQPSPSPAWARLGSLGHAHHQLPRGGDPGGPQDRQAAGRGRRQDRHSRDDEPVALGGSPHGRRPRRSPVRGRDQGLAGRRPACSS